MSLCVNMAKCSYVSLCASSESLEKFLNDLGVRDSGHKYNGNHFNSLLSFIVQETEVQSGKGRSKEEKANGS